MEGIREVVEGMMDIGGWIFMIALLRGAVVVVGLVLLVLCVVFLFTHKKKPTHSRSVEGVFGDRFKELREERDMSVDEVAAHLNVSSTVIQRFEQGTLEPHVVDIVKIADLFGVSCDDLLREQPQETKEEATEAEDA